jgi:hypothetical protein
MLRITCDLCGKELRVGEDHFVIKIEVFAKHDPSQLTEEDLEEDHMEAISQLLQEMDEQEADECVEPVRHHLRYDSCPECRTRFLRNPLNKELSKEAIQKFDFSEN